MIAKYKIALPVIVVVLASMAILVAGIVLSQRTGTNENDIRSDDKVGQGITAAKKAAEDGDIDTVKKQYTKLIEAEGNTKHKIMLMIDWSAVLYAAGHAKESLEVAKTAEEFSEDKFLIADWLSRVYEHEGEYELAVKYYKLAAELADSSMNDLGLDRDHYDSEAKRVEGLIE